MIFISYLGGLACGKVQVQFDSTFVFKKNKNNFKNVYSQVHP